MMYYSMDKTQQTAGDNSATKTAARDGECVCTQSTFYRKFIFIKFVVFHIEIVTMWRTCVLCLVCKFLINFIRRNDSRTLHSIGMKIEKTVWCRWKSSKRTHDSTCANANHRNIHIHIFSRLQPKWLLILFVRCPLSRPCPIAPFSRHSFFGIPLPSLDIYLGFSLYLATLVIFSIKLRSCVWVCTSLPQHVCVCVWVRFVFVHYFVLVQMRCTIFRFVPFMHFSSAHATNALCILRCNFSSPFRSHSHTKQ